MRFEPLQFGTKNCMFQLTGHHKTICVKNSSFRGVFTCFGELRRNVVAQLLVLPNFQI